MEYLVSIPVVLRWNTERIKAGYPTFTSNHPVQRPTGCASPRETRWKVNETIRTWDNPNGSDVFEAYCT